MELIEDFIKNHKFKFRTHYFSDFIISEDMSQEMKNHIIFLRDKISFFYKDNLCDKNPFSPMMEMVDGTRSSAVEDLNEDDISHLKTILNVTKDPILIAKIHDILWVLNHDKKDALKASKIYYQFFKDNKDDELYLIVPPLKRSLYLLYEVKENQALINYIDLVLDKNDYKDENYKRIICSYMIEIINTCLPKRANKFIVKIENQCHKNIKNDDVSLSIVEFLIKYYKSIHDKEKIKKYEFLYVEICKNINEERMPHGYEYLKKAIDILDDEYEDELDVLKFQLDETYKKLHDSFHFVSMSRNEKVANSLDEAQKQIIRQFESIESGLLQFLLLIKEFKPMSKESLQEQIDAQKGFIGINLFNNLQFDNNKKLIFESSEAGSDKKQEHQISQILQLYNLIMHDLILRPFIFNLKLDDELKDTLKEIVSHNLFVPVTEIDSVYESIISWLQKNIRGGMFKLVALFENGCREFLKQNGIYPTIKKGSREVKIDLNHMFVDKTGKNRYRNKIKEIIEEDLALSIEYLSCRPLSGNIRNNYYHYGCGNEKNYYPDEMVLFFLLIKAYCLGYDSNANKKTTK